MKAAALLLIATVNAASTSTSYFRFVRPVVNAPQSQAQTCLVLDAQQQAGCPVIGQKHRSKTR